MGQISGPNGEQLEDEKPYSIVLTMDRKTLRVDLNTEIKDIDTVLNMLATAVRFMDTQYRIASGIKAQEMYKQHQTDMQVAAAMLKGAARS